MEKTDTQPIPARLPIYWMHEAITYLGLDRLGLAPPDMALQRVLLEAIIGGDLGTKKK